jgi:hypothetical protein
MKYYKINIPEKFGDSGLLENLREEILNYEGGGKIPLMWNNKDIPKGYDEDTDPKVKVRTNYRESQWGQKESKPWYSKYIARYLIELMHPLPMGNKWWNHYQKGYGQGTHTHDEDNNPKCLFGSILYVCGTSPTVFIEPDGRKIRPEVKDGDFLLFESWVPHYATAESERMTISANFYDLGSEESTTSIMYDWDDKMENRGFERIVA